MGSDWATEAAPLKRSSSQVKLWLVSSPSGSKLSDPSRVISAGVVSVASVVTS